MQPYPSQRTGNYINLQCHIYEYLLAKLVFEQINCMPYVRHCTPYPTGIPFIARPNFPARGCLIHSVASDTVKQTAVVQTLWLLPHLLH